MDLTPLLFDKLDPEKLALWWDQLSKDQKFEYASFLYDQLQAAGDKYCETIDPWELYYKLTHKYRDSLDELFYPIDWNMDLHMDSANYENFMDCKDEIIGDLAEFNIDWFCEIFPLVPELKPDELKTMLISYFEGMPVWRE